MGQRTAALLQTHGDPFVTSYWFRNYERVWRDSVDELYVHVNGQQSREAVDWIVVEALRLGARVIVRDGRLVHGVATRELVQACDADVVLLIEDDAYVRDPAAVRRALDRIKCGEADVIATPRGGMSPEVEAYAFEKWGRFEIQDGGAGPGLWPCFFFARTADLRTTDMRFESWTWSPGETIPGLEYKVGAAPVTTDTMTAVAFQLRAAGKRIVHCVQHKELWHKVLPPHGAPWFHAGGLSNGDFINEGWDGGGARPGLGGTNEGNDWAHRCWWWGRCARTARDTFPSQATADYSARLGRLVDYLGVEYEVARWDAVLAPWINWDDQA
jgi:hypothetical protein